MAIRVQLRLFLLILLPFASLLSSAQSVTTGIHYQAVARDNLGKELADRDIDVRFSVISGNPIGQLVYQELYSKVRTSKYGVFSLVVGKGTNTGGTFTDLGSVQWGQANHYLKVEVKFNNDFIDMGTMQFLAVPYALYALKSLEPGPQGPIGLQGIQGPKGDQGLKGDPGDPASDKQTLSFDGTNLSIFNGNTINLSSLNIPHSLTILGDTLSIYGGNKVGLPNQIQDLTLDVNNILKITKNTTAASIDLSKYLDNINQTIGFNPSNNFLSISNGNAVDLTPMKQDLSLAGNTLTITNKVSPAAIDLSTYMQTLGLNSSYILSISGGNTVDLSPIKNDAIQDLTLDVNNKLKITKNPAATELDLGRYLDNTDSQMLTYDSLKYSLSISGGNSIKLGRIIAFRAKKTVSETGYSIVTDYDFIPGTVVYNDGGGFDPVTGVFTAPVEAIYTFNLGFTASGTGDSRVLKLFLNGSLYEIVNTGINGGSSFDHSVTMKLVIGDKVKMVINTGTSNESGTGTFSGFRVY